ncbi:hypothetical protein AVEN_101240-1 [Araneus ventricosus]|uniref:Uncharacterized protein n=1 Tax=Araneus ventricosus TaxID=182803 RepID=A0A4Y2Q701_ARAVE|nr:hypothetical protein AVEN_101240-1 [Araneus ventricosus]
MQQIMNLHPTHGIKKTQDAAENRLASHPRPGIRKSQDAAENRFASHPRDKKIAECSRKWTCCQPAIRGISSQRVNIKVTNRPPYGKTVLLL